MEWKTKLELEELYARTPNVADSAKVEALRAIAEQLERVGNLLEKTNAGLDNGVDSVIDELRVQWQNSPDG